MPVVSLLLSNVEKKALDQLVFWGKYKSRSDAIRAGLLLLYQQHNMKPDARRDVLICRGGARDRSDLYLPPERPEE